MLNDEFNEAFRELLFALSNLQVVSFSLFQPNWEPEWIGDFRSYLLQPLETLDQLRVLGLDGVRLGDDDMRIIGTLTNLFALGLECNEISDFGIGYLQPLRGLEELNLGLARIDRVRRVL
ncbi:MAG TPA: hypothetical protein VKU87_11575 [Thermomicrobiaceae bacterium]|nr:hypothetical protein [Thermomicrobiaceae bacterium]